LIAIPRGASPLGMTVLDLGAFHFNGANVPKVLKDSEIDANQPSGRSFFN
jgi:hypothetical protein